MKRGLIVLSAIIILQACNYEADKPEIVNEVYDPTDEELFAACSDLQGIGQYVIGKTTFKQVLNDKEYRDGTLSFDRESNLYNGHWGQEYWNKKGYHLPNDLDKANWMEKESRGRIKQLNSRLTCFNVGSLDFDKFDMAFLNDTLVAIWYYPKREFVKDVLNHYKEKYGNGRGHLNSYESRSMIGDDVNTLVATSKLDEMHTWENAIVALDYVMDEYFHTEPNQKPTSHYNHSYLIYSKSRYPVFETLLMELSEQFDSIQQEDKKKSLDVL